jgi:hypothetical protein
MKSGASPSWLRQILDIRKRFSTARTEKDKTYYQSRVSSIDHRIDELVMELYGVEEGELL